MPKTRRERQYRIWISICHTDPKTDIFYGFYDYIEFSAVEEGFLWIKENLPIYKGKCDRLQASMEIDFYGSENYLGSSRSWTQDGYFTDDIPKVKIKQYTIKDKYREVNTPETVFKLDSSGQRLSWEDDEMDKFPRIEFAGVIFD